MSVRAHTYLSASLSFGLLSSLVGEMVNPREPAPLNPPSAVASDLPPAAIVQQVTESGVQQVVAMFDKVLFL